ncbi:hypothetical protein CAPTEDRAFT_125014, partial [Capitella teleta]
IGLAATPVNVAISEVTGTSLKLTWSPGSEDPIDSYRITYKQIFADSDMSTRVNVQSTEYTVTGLSPRAIYEFRVAAVNSFGIGRPSIPVNVITAEIPPGSPPQNVRAQSLDSSSLVVQWEKPELPNGWIQGYKVYYTLTPNIPLSQWIVHDVDDGLQTTLSGLFPSSTYTICVRAFNKEGEGPISEAIEVATQPAGQTQ